MSNQKLELNNGLNFRQVDYVVVQFCKESIADNRTGETSVFEYDESIFINYSQYNSLLTG